jgi:hypothetical protein
LHRRQHLRRRQLRCDRQVLQRGTNFPCVNDEDCIDNGQLHCGSGRTGAHRDGDPDGGHDDDGCAVNPNASTSGSSALLVVAVILGALRRRSR